MLEKTRFWEKGFRFYFKFFWLLGFSRRDKLTTQKLAAKHPINHSPCHVVLLSERRDVESEKSPLKYEIKYGLYIMNGITNKKIVKFGILGFLCF